MWATGAMTSKTYQPHFLASRLLDVTVLYDGGDPRRKNAFVPTCLKIVNRHGGICQFEHHFRFPKEWANPLIGIVHFRLNFFPTVCGLDVYVAFSDAITKEIEIMLFMGGENREMMIVAGLGQ